MNSRERVEAERRRLREEANELLERCETDKHPSHEEVREFSERVAKLEQGAASRKHPYGILSD